VSHFAVRVANGSQLRQLGDIRNPSRLIVVEKLGRGLQTVIGNSV
jgi:hypothetical protein